MNATPKLGSHLLAANLLRVARHDATSSRQSVGKGRKEKKNKKKERMSSLEDTFGCIFSQLELDASAPIRIHDIVHARVRRPLPRCSREAKMIPQEDVADDHLHRLASKEAARAYDPAVAKVQVILAGCGIF